MLIGTVPRMPEHPEFHIDRCCTYITVLSLPVAQLQVLLAIETSWILPLVSCGALQDIIFSIWLGAHNSTRELFQPCFHFAFLKIHGMTSGNYWRWLLFLCPVSSAEHLSFGYASQYANRYLPSVRALAPITPSPMDIPLGEGDFFMPDWAAQTQSITSSPLR